MPAGTKSTTTPAVSKTTHRLSLIYVYMCLSLCMYTGESDNGVNQSDKNRVIARPSSRRKCQGRVAAGLPPLSISPSHCFSTTTRRTNVVYIYTAAVGDDVGARYEARS